MADDIRRRSPRRPFTITESGIKRIMLGQQGEAGAFAPAAHAAHKPPRLTEPAASAILAVAHSDRGALDAQGRQAIAAAALLADAQTAVIALVFGALTENLGPAGADKVIAVPLDGWAPDQELACLHAVIAQFQPRHILFPDNAIGDGDLGRRLAATQPDGAATHIVELRLDGVTVRQGARLARRALPRVMLLDPDIIECDLPFVGLGESADVSFPDRGAGPYQDLGLRAIAAAQLPLEEADFILAAGNGVADIPTFLALADNLGAAVGASRVAVDDGKFPRAKQIGATGKTVSASVYMAIGISGAIQHLQGIKACRHVIAINQDASAPIAKRADLTIVADAQAVMQHLLRDITDPGRNAPLEETGP